MMPVVEFRLVKQLFVMALAACMLLGCSNPHNFEVAKLTDEQKEEMGKKLTADEGAKLMGYVGRTILSGQEVPAGVTVGQAIKEQEAWQAKEEAEAAKAAELNKKAEAERKAQQDALAKMLAVKLIGKRNSTGEFQQRVVFMDLAFTNKGDKDIAGFKGILHFTDMFGDSIIDITWSNDHGVEARQGILQKGAGMTINQFLPDHMKMWNAEADKIKLSFEVQAIVFKDGTRLDAPG
ncbi:hypothetical protein [Rugamonas rivuli]|uniref:DUF4352 domain-containing protein n=1 Tax=Rugamonas rivuli TaxID=2743358 RepID=A0A843SAV9_9BURK|nr:hypothetical protein [Rugamonas rivuli]MQA19628.1 hypothetical protein [Rugamonas rivuli]